MVPAETFSSLAPGSSVIGVRDHHHEVGLAMGIILMYNTLSFSYKHLLYKHLRLKKRQKISIYVVNDVTVTQAQPKSEMLIKKT